MEGGSEVSWSSFSATMAVEESELMAQLLGPYPFSSEQDQDLSLGIHSLFCSDHVTHSYYGSQDANSSLCCWPQENNGSAFSTSSFFAPSSDYQEYYMSEADVVPAINSNNHEEMVFHMVEGTMTVPSNSLGYLNEETSSEDSAVNSSEQDVALDQKLQHKRKFSMDEVTKPAENENKFDIATEISKKKANVSSQVLKSAKISKSKKILKSNASSEEEENNAAALNVQSSSSCCSEDYSNASQELNGGSTSSSPKGPAALNLNGKARASRGSATDPQSLYARKRRERINERLRILQNLVPNGTKVDISTMLEEAVQYVKFLQLQIKLLSSDELWMYAPLAYNGMDIGFDLKISPPRQ